MSVALLATLQDVPGVVGSFLASRSGEPLEVAMPAFVEPRDVGLAASRLCSVLDCLAESEIGAEQCTLRFADYRLVARVCSAGILCVLATHDLNGPALRMASKLVARKWSERSRVPKPPPSLPGLSPRTAAVEAVEGVPSVPAALAAPALDPPSTRRSVSAAPESRSRQAMTAPTSSRTFVFRGRRYEG